MSVLNATIYDLSPLQSKLLGDAIIHRIFGSNELILRYGLYNEDHADLLSLNAYLTYYADQCAQIALHDDGRHVVVRTHVDLAWIVDLLKKSTPEHASPDSSGLYATSNGSTINGNAISQSSVPPPTRIDLLSQIIARWPDATPEMCENSLNLAARVFTMIPTGRVRHSISSAGRSRAQERLRWKDDETFATWLSRLLHQHVPPRQNCDSVRLPLSLDAWALDKITGIPIRFTDNLVDHLSIVEDFDDSRTLLVFQHVSFLEYQRGLPYFPTEFIEETLDTYALLFPQPDFAPRVPGGRGVGVVGGGGKRAKFWEGELRTRGGGGHGQDPSPGAAGGARGSVVDGRVVRCGSLHLDDRHITNFVFWRDRLVTLKQTYDDSTPKTALQWWRDRRNRVVWITCWIGVVVVVVAILTGVAGIVFGALQMHKEFVFGN